MACLIQRTNKVSSQTPQIRFFKSVKSVPSVALILGSKIDGTDQIKSQKSKIANSNGLRYKRGVKRRQFICLLLLLLMGGGGAFYWWHYQWRDHSQDIPILAAARRYGVEPALVKAVVWRESRFHPQARGSRGEIGLMQVMLKAAARDWTDAEHLPPLTPEHLLDPGTNTLVGAWYLGKLLKRYAQTDNPLPYALADYNAGRSNVLKWKQGAATTNSAVFIQQISFPSTKNYVRSVMRRYEHYQPIFPGKEN